MAGAAETMTRKLLIFSLILLAFILRVGLTAAKECNTPAECFDEASKGTQEQQSIKQQLADIDAQISSLSSRLSSASANLASVSRELTKVEGQLVSITKQLDTLRNQLEDEESLRNLLVRRFYIDSRVAPLEIFLSESGFAEGAQKSSYFARSLNEAHLEIASLNGEITSYEKNRATAEKSRKELTSLRDQYNAQVAYASSTINYLSSQQAALSQQLDQIKSEISKALARREYLIEQQQRGNFTGDPPKPFKKVSGTATYLSIYGEGRYIYIGHGVGMPQYEAEGYARQGKSYSWILAKYFKSTSISWRGLPSTIKVRVWQNKYNNPCMGGSTYKWRTMSFNTYLKGISEMPSSWTLEAQKAQAILARTYAIRTYSALGWIDSTPSHQCYTGNTSRTNWNKAVDETTSGNKGRVLLYGGGLAGSYYHASSGGNTENNENIWSWWNGNGYSSSPRSYLRGVSDTGSNYHSKWATWSWNTKYSYTIRQLERAVESGLSSKEVAWLNQIGDWADLELVPGVAAGAPSSYSRVKWVKIRGENGGVRSLPGWVFKAAFNTADSKYNSDDLIFSKRFVIRYEKL